MGCKWQRQNGSSPIWVITIQDSTPFSVRAKTKFPLKWSRFSTPFGQNFPYHPSTNERSNMKGMTPTNRMPFSSIHGFSFPPVTTIFRPKPPAFCKAAVS